MGLFGSKTSKTPKGLHFGREINHEDHRGHRKLVLVRHGQMDFNLQHRLPSQLPGISLNADGLREAEATAQAIRGLPLTAIIASPLERTMQTAAAINAGRGLEIRQDKDLLDTNYGPFGGKDYLVLDATDRAWQRFTTDPYFAPKGVESFAHVQARAVRAAERWRAAPDVGEWVALVTHSDLVKLIVGHYMGIPLGNIPLINMDNAAVSLLTFHPEIQRAPTLLCFNWTSPALWLTAAQHA
jgi:broad specificity phosphatase PhoE